jgi:hypothetical protein
MEERMRSIARNVGIVIVIAGTVPLLAGQDQTVFQGEAIEEFLQRGEVKSIRDLGTGITRPQRATLAFNGVENDALYKTIDVRKQGATTLEDGTVEVDFRDTWETEVAAYRLDRLLELGMVPATVERRIGRDTGSLQWWVESMGSEADRQAQGLSAPDIEAWNREMFKVRLFDQLISNTDRHPRNMLVTKDFQVRLIDHSRSFRPDRELRNPEVLQRFSRTLLDAIGRLDRDGLREAIGRYLSNAEIDRLLQRRDAIVELARQRVAELGEAAVIYP